MSDINDVTLKKNNKLRISRLEKFGKAVKKKGLEKQTEHFVRDPEMKGKKVYHGTIKDFDAKNIKPSEQGLMGHGTYLTDDPNVAKSYAKGGGMTHPHRLRAEGKIKNSPAIKSYKLSKDVKLLDMQGELGEKERSIFNKYIKDILPEEHYEDYKILKGQKGHEAMKELQEIMFEADIYSYEGNEILTDLSYDLKSQLGYDGLSHQGGIATKNKPHNVAVMFDTEYEGPKKMKISSVDRPYATPEGTIKPPVLKTKNRIMKKILKGGSKVLPFLGPAAAAGLALKGEAEAAFEIMDPSGSEGLTPQTSESIKHFAEQRKFNALKRAGLQKEQSVDRQYYDEQNINSNSLY